MTTGTTETVPTEVVPVSKEVCFGKNSISDLTIIVGDTSFQVHKTTLAMDSEYFDALMFRDFAEKDKNPIELDADPVAFKRMLNFIYEGCFGDDVEFFKCPSKFKDPSEHVLEELALYEVLNRFDAPKAVDYFWKMRNENACHEFEIQDNIHSFFCCDCEHCINGPLICAIYNGTPGTEKYSVRAVKAWMETYYPILPNSVMTTDNAMPRIIKEMISTVVDYRTEML